MDGRSELLVYMGASLVTIAGLFGLQMWYASYLDVAVVHGPSHAPIYPAVAALHAKEQKELASAPLPIDKAIALLGEKGRAGFPKIAAQPSTDLSAMSGWMHRPGFKPYEPRRQPSAQAAPVEAPPADPGAVATAAPQAPAPAPTPAAPKPAPKRVAPAPAHP